MSLRISLLRHPWAADAAHVWKLIGPAELRWRLRPLPAWQRYAVAVWLDGAADWRRAGDPKPYVVETAAGCPLRSADGFLVLRGGLDHALCAAAWREIAAQEAREKARAAFFADELPAITRQAVFGGPKEIDR